MIPVDLLTTATTRQLMLIDTNRLFQSNLGLGEVSVMGGNGIVVGTLIPTPDGRWLALPGGFPFSVGDAAGVVDYLAAYGTAQNFPVVVTFDRGQMASLERNEDILLDAIKRTAHELAGGKVEGVVVGSAQWQAPGTSKAG